MTLQEKVCVDLYVFYYNNLYINKLNHAPPNYEA